MQNIAIRRAAAEDCNFIVEAIIAADKGDSSLLSYATIFNLNEGQVAEILKQALEEEIEGQEICVSHFLIAEADGRPAAACASWIEAKDGITSGHIKASLLLRILGKDAWDKATDRLKAVAETTIERTRGAVQLESIYTKPELRGTGLTPNLIGEHLRIHRTRTPEVKRAQLILLKNNILAAKRYRKIGFEQVAERTGTSPLLGDILSCPAKIMMEKQF